jgi:hypothetical protein
MSSQPSGLCCRCCNSALPSTDLLCDLLVYLQWPYQRHEAPQPTGGRRFHHRHRSPVEFPGRKHQQQAQHVQARHHAVPVERLKRRTFRWRWMQRC